MVMRKYGAMRIGFLKCLMMMFFSRSFSVSSAPSLVACLAKIKLAPLGKISKFMALRANTRADRVAITFSQDFKRVEGYVVLTHEKFMKAKNLNGIIAIMAAFGNAR